MGEPLTPLSKRISSGNVETLKKEEGNNVVTKKNFKNSKTLKT